MSRRTTRVMIGCGLVASAGTLFGFAYAGSPPEDDHKKHTATAKVVSSVKSGKSDKGEKEATDDVHGAASKQATEKPGHEDKPEPKHQAAADDESPEAGAKASLTRLREGNQRWMKEKESNPNNDASRRASTAENGQQPFAAILTCADSRIPVERVFDCGVGDVFVIRVAGNVVGGDASGTIEYGAEHLHVPLLVVMGHTKCGAVAAAASGGDPGGNITQLVEKITPAVSRAKQLHPEMDEKEIVVEAVKENVMQSIFDLLRSSSVVREMVHQNKIQIVGAVYDIGSGKVEWIGEHPWQDALVEAFDAKHAKQVKQSTATATATESPHGH